MIEWIDKVSLKDDDLLIALGDIIDRGNKSKEVYTYLKNGPNTIVLMGNHERKHKNGVLSYAQNIVKIQFGEPGKQYPPNTPGPISTGGSKTAIYGHRVSRSCTQSGEQYLWH